MKKEFVAPKLVVESSLARLTLQSQACSGRYCQIG
jgi:hypothetical protein